MAVATELTSSADRPFAVDPAQHKEFVERGLVKVQNVFDPRVAAEVVEELWRRFDTWNIHRGDPSSWQSLGEPEIRQVLKKTRRVRGLQSIYTDKTDSIARTLAATDELEKQKPLLLLTFSGMHSYVSGEVVPYTTWHSDTPNLPSKGAAGVIVLGFLNHVRPRGGGTMVVAGSHRMHANAKAAITSKVAKRRLKKHAYFRELLGKNTSNRQRFLDESACVEGVELKVIELTGEPGDAYFLDGSLLHTITRNYLDEPRIMVRGFYGTAKLTSHYHEVFEKMRAKKHEEKLQRKQS